MSLLVAKYHGTELPIYDPEQQVVRSHKVVPLLNLESSTFLRAVRVQVGRRLQRHGIDKVLARVDRELLSVAGRCETTVLEHEWGLYPLVTPSERMRYQIYQPPNPDELRIPLGHIVVAKVDVVRHPIVINPRSQEGLRIRQGVHDYEHAPNLHKLFDIDERQFVSGITDAEIASGMIPVMPKLVDIEPRIK
jgi:hypothetical protein